MGQITGQSRNQMTLFPEVIDDFVSVDNPVRFLDAFVDGMQLKELGFCNLDERI